MLVKFVMRDRQGAIVAGIPTVTADSVVLPAVGNPSQWQVDAPLGSLVTCELEGAITLDVLMPDVDPHALDEQLAGIRQSLVPTEGVLVSPATLGTDGEPIGRVQPYAVVTVYRGGEAEYRFNADADGDYAYRLPEGSTWRLHAVRPGYRDTTAEVAT